MYRNIIFITLIISLGACAPKDVDRTKLVEYAKNGQVQEIKYLIKRGALNAQEQHSIISNALIAASYEGNIKILNLLHSVYPSFDTSGKRTEEEPSITPLISAINNNQLKTIEYLLNNGASIEYKGKTESTPLSHAMFNWCSEVPLDIRKLEGESYKHALPPYKDKQVQTIELLLKRGANPNTVDVLGKTPIAVVVSPCLAPDWDSTHKLLDLLLKYGAHLDGDNGQEIPIINAASPEMISLLLEKGADVNASNYFGMTALSAAVMEENIAKIEVLIQAGANINYLSKFYESPLSLAIRSKNLQIIKLLLDNGADLELLIKETPHSNYSITPLMLACATQNIDIVKLLLEYNGGRELSPSSLEFATFTSTPEIVELLLKNGLDVNQQNIDYKTTPLIVAIAKGDLKIAKILLQNKANPNIKDKNGHTALWFARQKGNKQAIELLRKYGAK